MTNTTIREEESERDLAYWLGRDYVSDELRHRLADASILIVPQEGFRDYEGPLFPVATEEFFRFAREELPDDAEVDICIEDGDYKELALHESLIIIATVSVASSFLAGLAVNLVWHFLERRIGSKAKEKKTTAKATIIVNTTKTAKTDKRAVEIHYEGPADQLKSSMMTKINELIKRDEAGSNG